MSYFMIMAVVYSLSNLLKHFSSISLTELAITTKSFKEFSSATEAW